MILILTAVFGEVFKYLTEVFVTTLLILRDTDYCGAYTYIIKHDIVFFLFSFAVLLHVRILFRTLQRARSILSFVQAKILEHRLRMFCLVNPYIIHFAAHIIHLM